MNLHEVTSRNDRTGLFMFQCLYVRLRGYRLTLREQACTGMSERRIVRLAVHDCCVVLCFCKVRAKDGTFDRLASRDSVFTRCPVQVLYWHSYLLPRFLPSDSRK